MDLGCRSSSCDTEYHGTVQAEQLRNQARSLEPASGSAFKLLILLSSVVLGKLLKFLSFLICNIGIKVDVKGSNTSKLLTHSGT